MSNPLDYAKREAFTQATELGIEEVRVVSATLFEALIKKFFKESKSGPDNVDVGAAMEKVSEAYSVDEKAVEMSAADMESEDSAPIIQMTNRIIEDAYIQGASDIHIEPMEKELLIRYRMTACARKSSACPSRRPTPLSPASRSCATWTSRSAGCHRTDVSSSSATRRRTWTSTFASPPGR